MKQLSVEEKAKRYDEAIERAKTKLTNEVASDIFTELKGSREDEMIRVIKEVILNSVPYKINILTKDTTITAEEAIAWLEKQGEQKSQGKTALEEIKEEKVDNANRVDPKFKCGDWVVHNIIKDIFLIKLINDGYCTLEGINGNIYYPCHPTEDLYHLWTIQDAKDGDVLYCENSGIEYIVMSKGVNERGNIDSYFRYNSLDGFGISIPSVLSARQDDIAPATKEQRDLLFQKMKEAGYEWDAEKKELKKIEHNFVWSEEDENHLIGITQTIGGAIKYNVISHKTGDKQITWLKFLKERCTWKPSKEQMYAVKDAIDYLGGDTKIVRKYLMSLYEDLKKL